MPEAKKDHAAVRIFPPGVPVLVILAGIGLSLLVPVKLGFTVPRVERYGVGGAVVLLAFLILAVWPVTLFRRSGQSPNPHKTTPGIVERGPYRLTRNPMYLHMILVCLGFAIMRMDVWILALTPVGAWILQKFAIEPEEAYLEHKFGEVYLDYKRRVRRWI